MRTENTPPPSPPDSSFYSLLLSGISLLSTSLVPPCSLVFLPSIFCCTPSFLSSLPFFLLPVFLLPPNYLNPFPLSSAILSPLHLSFIVLHITFPSVAPPPLFLSASLPPFFPPASFHIALIPPPISVVVSLCGPPVLD